MFATTFGAGQVAYSILWFFLFFIEIWLMISVFIDIFRSHDLKGWAKAAWVLFVFILPIVGILAYLIVRGDKMRAHQTQVTANQQDIFRHFLDHGVGHLSKTEELAKLADLHDRGEVSAEEYQRLRSEIIDRPPGN